MNKNVKKIKLILAAFIAVIIFGGISEVEAKQYAECTYKSTDGKSIFNVQLMSDQHLTTNGGTKRNDDLKNVFKVDNTTLYCPDKVYIVDTWSNSGSTATNAKQTAYLESTSGSKEYTIATENDNAIKYTPIVSTTTGKLEACSTSAADDLMTLVRLRNHIATASNDELKDVATKIGNINPKRQCSEEDKKQVSDKWSEVSTELEKKIDSSSMSAQDKTSALATLNKSKSERIIVEYEPKLYKCERFDPTLKAVIQKVLLWIRIAVPIVLIILVSVDFSQAVISQDQEAVKKAISKSIKRAIAALAVFFVPLLVSVMISWLDKPYETFDVSKDDICTEVIK